MRHQGKSEPDALLSSLVEAAGLPLPAEVMRMEPVSRPQCHFLSAGSDDVTLKLGVPADSLSTVLSSYFPSFSFFSSSPSLSSCSFYAISSSYSFSLSSSYSSSSSLSCSFCKFSSSPITSSFYSFSYFSPCPSPPPPPPPIFPVTISDETNLCLPSLSNGVVPPSSLLFF